MTADREAALKWQASMTAQQVNDKREAIIAQLEAAGQEMWCNGTCKAWLETAPDSVKEISKTVNGNMLRDLGNAVIHHDVFSADLFRTGATAGVCVGLCVKCTHVQLVVRWSVIRANACKWNWRVEGICRGWERRILEAEPLRFA